MRTFEKYIQVTKSMEKKIHGGLGHSALHLTAAKVITVLISLISSMLLSRFRTIEEYGTYSQLTIAITLATSLVMLGLPNSINFFLAKADTSEERRDFLSVYYTLNTFLCVILGGVLVAAVPLIEGYFQNPLIGKFAYFLAIYPWANITISSISNVLVVYNRTARLMLINVLTSLVSLLSVVFIQIFGCTFEQYILVFLIGNVLLALWIHVIIARAEKGIRPRMRWDIVKKIFAYSIPIGLASLIGTINVEIDKLMIGGQLGTEELAIYTNAGKELPLTMVATSLTAVLMPQIVRKLKQEDTLGAVSLWKTSVEISYIILCFFTTACIVFAPQIMTILYSEKYLPGVSVFRIYSIVLLLRVTYFGLVLNSVGKTRFILWSSIASLVLNVVLNYTMYQLLGFIGPAVATVLSILLIALLQIWVSGRVIHVPFSQIFPWGRLLLITLCNLAWGAAAYLVLWLLGIGTGAVDILIAIGIGAVCTLVYVFLFKKNILSTWRRLNNEQ